MCTVLDEIKAEGRVFTPIGIVSMILDSVKYTVRVSGVRSLSEI